MTWFGGSYRRLTWAWLTHADWSVNSFVRRLLSNHTLRRLCRLCGISKFLQICKTVALESCCDDRFFLRNKMQIWSNFPQCDPGPKPAISVRWKRHFIVSDGIYFFCLFFYGGQNLVWRWKSVFKTKRVLRKQPKWNVGTVWKGQGKMFMACPTHPSWITTDLRDVFPSRKGISLPLGLIFQNVDDCGYSTFAAGWSTNKPIAGRRQRFILALLFIFFVLFSLGLIREKIICDLWGVSWSKRPTFFFSQWVTVEKTTRRHVSASNAITKQNNSTVIKSDDIVCRSNMSTDRVLDI